MSRERSTQAIEYIQRVFVNETQKHQEITRALEADSKLGINVSPYEGALLSFLVQLVRAKNIVEIGTLYAYSTLWMAQALPEDGRILSLEKSPEHYEKAKALIEGSDFVDRIELRLGDARELLKDISFSPDLVFIDADKGGYKDYLDWAMEKLEPGGLIVGDNTFLFGHVYGDPWVEKATEKAKASMNYFNETLANSKQFRSIILPTVEGMTLGLKI